MDTNAPKIEIADDEDVRRYADAPAEPAAADNADALRAQVADLHDKLLRATAEAANISRRLTDEKRQAVRRANADFALDLLPIVDDFERTMASLAPGADGDPVRRGVQLIYEKLLKTLRDHHVQPIESLGQPFDPTLHRALLEEASADHPPGTVLKEYARGYRIHDTVLRPAQVVVAKSPENS